MMQKLSIFAVLAVLAAATANAQDAVSQPATPALVPGAIDVVVASDVRVVLHKIIRPGAKDSVGGAAFTEYAFRVTNAAADRELRLSDVALTVAGEVRRPARSMSEIMNYDQTVANAKARTEGLGLLQLAAAFIPGVGGVVASQAGIVAATANRSMLESELMNDPRKWGHELAARSFQNVQGGAVMVLPGETANGSIWVRQSPTERASLVQFFARSGDGSARLVRLPIEDIEPVPASVQTVAPIPKTD